jgi:hypothetical protein
MATLDSTITIELSPELREKFDALTNEVRALRDALDTLARSDAVRLVGEHGPTLEPMRFGTTPFPTPAPERRK